MCYYFTSIYIIAIKVFVEVACYKALNKVSPFGYIIASFLSIVDEGIYFGYS